ncbi:MAG: MerR family transcriptional regulator [Muribaculaceae bacterium]|nr:MerR family transcriptional regulator [Muribaculaceae bacterium]
MADELDKMFYRIGDVSIMLDLPQSTIRFWEKEFSELRPRRNGGGIRRYTPADVEQLRIIRFLIREKGLTIEGAREHLRRNRRDLERKHEVIGRLKNIRRRLTDMLEALDQRQRK